MFIRLSLSCTRGISPFLSGPVPRSTNKLFRPLQTSRPNNSVSAKSHFSETSRGFASGVKHAQDCKLNSTALLNARIGKLGGAAVVASLGLGLATFARPVLCDTPKSTNPTLHPSSSPDPLNVQRDASSMGTPLPPPPKSSLNMFELSFGAVCGICAGVFVKKGVKLIAFFFGGVFVILQYLASMNIINVNWSGAQSRYEKAFNKTDPATGTSKAPTVYALWNWIVNFLAADFPPRATFIAGLLLGIRIG